MTKHKRKNADVLTSTLRLLYDAADLMSQVDDLDPVYLRLLSEDETENLSSLAYQLRTVAQKLGQEKKPPYERGERVRIKHEFDTVRDWVPVAGTIGVVEDVVQNKYGWWVVVRMNKPFMDIDGKYHDCTDIVLRYKADELQKVGGKRVKL